MAKNKTISFRISDKQAEQLKEINFSLFHSSISETLREMIDKQYMELAEAGVIE